MRSQIQQKLFVRLFVTFIIRFIIHRCSLSYSFNHCMSRNLSIVYMYYCLMLYTLLMIDILKKFVYIQLNVIVYLYYHKYFIQYRSVRDSRIVHGPISSNVIIQCCNFTTNLYILKYFVNVKVILKDVKTKEGTNVHIKQKLNVTN